MLLELRYSEKIQHQTSAFFIKESSPDGWLHAIDKIDIPLNQLEFYVVPESIHSVYPVGLFVIIKKETEIKNKSILDPYGIIGEKLFLPIHSHISPEITTEELNKILLYEIQLFHPSIGLIGFEKSDQIDLVDLLEYTLPKEQNWDFAQSGLPPMHRLKEIHIEQPTVKDIIEAFKESIDTKPFEDILKPEEKKTNNLEKILDPIKRVLIRIAIFLIGLIPTTTSNKKGILNPVEDWLKKNLGDLEKKRNKELNRLLNLFDENMDEALKYAIPLESPYLNRGTATPSANLSRNSSIFDLRGLGGGGQVDTWDVSSYYFDLRNKYQSAAQKEIESNDYKKAAYIYAHLLGDYHAAAKVLEQGKHYREAAALYKEHIKNIPAAAECLEKGGLILEAIDLYTDLQKHEKVGDLYKKIGQDDNANKFYETTITISLKAGDYIQSSRIILDKLEQPDRAKEILLKGWKSSTQSESCLKQYFKIIESDSTKNLSYEIHDAYKFHTTKGKKTIFLNVLTHFIHKETKEDIVNTSRDIAYEIISEQISEGNTSNINSLNKFITNDRLIISDCSRFVSKQQLKPIQSTSAFQLDSSIKWQTATVHRNQFIALGIKNTRLHLVRGNWYGNFEYHSWTNRINTQDLTLISDPYHTNKIIIRVKGVLLEEKELPHNKYFDEKLLVISPTWLSKDFIGTTFTSDEKLISLKATKFSLTIYECNSEGEMRKPIDCKFETENGFLMKPSSSFSNFISRNGIYYTYKGNFFIKIKEDGAAERFNIDATITNLAATNNNSQFLMAIGTDKGFCIYKPEVGFNDEDPIILNNIIPVDIKFLSSTILAVAGKKSATIFQINNNMLNPLVTLEAQSYFVSILPTSHRSKCGFLEDTGRINICEIDIEES